MLHQLMLQTDWYELTIQDADLEFHDFGRDVARWEEITIALLRGYIERAYKRSKGKWESKYMETVYIDQNDPNFFDEYTVEVRNDQQEWIDKLMELREQIISGNLERDYQINGQWLQALRFDQHLFYPILCLREKDDNGKKVEVIEKHEKYAQPDTGAIHLLLKNLDEEWHNDDAFQMEMKRLQAELDRDRLEAQKWS